MKNGDHKKSVSVYSKEAGARVTFEFDDDLVQPTEALAKLFAEGVYKMLKENPWAGAPPTAVAMAWSMASLVANGASVASEQGKMPEGEFVGTVLDTLKNYYGEEDDEEEEIH